MSDNNFSVDEKGQQIHKPKEEKKDPPKEDKQESNEFWFVKSAAEESELLHKLQKKAFEQGIKPRGQFGSPPCLIISERTDNNEPIRLSFEDKFKNCGISFEHAIDRPQNFSSYYWPDVAEDIAEEHIFANEDYSLLKLIDWKKENLRKLEERISDIEWINDALVLAGIAKRDDNDEINYDGPAASQQILDKVKKLGRLPDYLVLSFSDKKFCINGLPTNINEFDLCCLHHGLSVFTSPKKATYKVAKLIYEKMKPLFEITCEEQVIGRK